MGDFASVRRIKYTDYEQHYNINTLANVCKKTSGQAIIKNKG